MTPIQSSSWEQFKDIIKTYHVSEYYNISFDELDKVLILSGDLGIHRIRDHYYYGNNENIFAAFPYFHRTKIYSGNLCVYKEHCQALPWGSSVDIKKLSLKTDFFYPKPIYVYKNYSLWCGRERYDHVFNKEFVFWRHGLSDEEYIRDLSNSKFVICPPGNGFDTYRFWEALYCGAIPIVIKNEFYRYFEELPFIELNSFNDFSADILEMKYNELLRRTNINLKKISVEYYKELFEK